MNSDNLLQLVQTGFRVTLGATTSAIETLQDSQKLQEVFSQFNSDLKQQMEVWSQKGEITEQEARKMMDSLWSQSGQATSSAADTTIDIVSETPNTTGSSVESESLQEDNESLSNDEPRPVVAR
jgi:polyhydroxyalkanoate synthesis regulator phasin